MSNSDAHDKEPAKHTFTTGQRLDAYSIVERGEGRNSVWVKCGAAWMNKDGSFQVRLDTLPIHGTLNLRVPKEAKEAQEGGNG